MEHEAIMQLHIKSKTAELKKKHNSNKCNYNFFKKLSRCQYLLIIIKKRLSMTLFSLASWMD